MQRIGLGGERRPLKRQLLLLRVDVSQSTGDDEQPLLEFAGAPPHITLPRGWAMLRLRTGVARYSSQPPGCLSLRRRATLARDRHARRLAGVPGRVAPGGEAARPQGLSHARAVQWSGTARYSSQPQRLPLPPRARRWRATGTIGQRRAFSGVYTGWGRGAPAWFTPISWLGAAPAAGGVQAQGLVSSRPLRIHGAAPCVLSADNPPDRCQEVMRGAGWARASNLRDLYGWRWACTPSVQGGEARDRYPAPKPKLLW